MPTGVGQNQSTDVVHSAPVEEVRIERLQATTFCAVVTVRSGARAREVDSRPSDAMALALHGGSPISVAEQVMADGGIDIPPGTDMKAASGRGAGSIAEEFVYGWRSHREAGRTSEEQIDSARKGSSRLYSARTADPWLKAVIVPRPRFVTAGKLRHSLTPVGAGANMGERVHKRAEPRRWRPKMPFVKGFGAIEIFLILLIIVIIFGVGRLPEVGAGLGKGIREFRRAFAGKESDSDETEENKVS